MGLILTLFKVPFVNRLINMFTNNNKSTITSSFLIGLSIIGIIEKDQIEILSGLNPVFVVPILSIFVSMIYLPKIYNYFKNRKLNVLKVKKEEKELIIDVLESDIKIKELEQKLSRV